jgi:hypothetical protein
MDPLQTHKADQYIAHARTFAAAVAAYFDELRTKGVARRDALKLTVAYITAVHLGASQLKPPEES